MIRPLADLTSLIISALALNVIGLLVSASRMVKEELFTFMTLPICLPDASPPQAQIDVDAIKSAEAKVLITRGLIDIENLLQRTNSYRIVVLIQFKSILENADFLEDVIMNRFPINGISQLLDLTPRN